MQIKCEQDNSALIYVIKKELGAALDDMDDAGAFSNVELDDAALATLMGMGGEQLQGSSAHT